MRSAGRRQQGEIYLIQQSEEMENDLSDFHHVGNKESIKSVGCKTEDAEEALDQQNK